MDQYKPSHFPGWCESNGELDLGTDLAENILLFFFLRDYFLLGSSPRPGSEHDYTTLMSAQGSHLMSTHGGGGGNEWDGKSAVFTILTTLMSL